jgi:hypothetical protein
MRALALSARRRKYYYICVLILLYMCPHTTIYVSSYYYIYICVLILLHIYVSSEAEEIASLTKPN